MAAEYLLDLHSFIRLLLVYGKKTGEKWSAGFLQRPFGEWGISLSYATKQSGLRSADLYRLLYSAADSPESGIAENTGNSGACGKLRSVLPYPGNK